MNKTSNASLLTGVCITSDSTNTFNPQGEYITSSNCIWGITMVTTDNAQNIWCIQSGTAPNAQAVAGKWTKSQPCWGSSRTPQDYWSILSMAFDAQARFINIDNNNEYTGAEWGVFANIPPTAPPSTNSTAKWTMTLSVQATSLQTAPATALVTNNCQELSNSSGWNFSYIAFDGKETMWGVYTSDGVTGLARCNVDSDTWSAQKISGNWAISSIGFDSNAVMWCVGKCMDRGGTRDSVGKAVPVDGGLAWEYQGTLGGWSVSIDPRECYPVAITDFAPSLQSNVLVFNQDELNVICVRPNTAAGQWSFLDFSAKSIRRTGKIDLSEVDSGHSFSFYLEQGSNWEFVSFTVEVTTTAATTATTATAPLTVEKPASPSKPGNPLPWKMTLDNAGGGTITGDAWFSASGDRLVLTVYNPNSKNETLGILLTAKNKTDGSKVTSQDPQITVKPQTSSGPNSQPGPK